MISGFASANSWWPISLHRLRQQLRIAQVSRDTGSVYRVRIRPTNQMVYMNRNMKLLSFRPIHVISSCHFTSKLAGLCCAASFTSAFRKAFASQDLNPYPKCSSNCTTLTHMGESQSIAQKGVRAVVGEKPQLEMAKVLQNRCSRSQAVNR